MVASQSSSLPLSRTQSLDSSSLPPSFPRVLSFRFVTSLHSYFITSFSATQDRPQPQLPQSLAHTSRRIGGVPTCTPSFEFPISHFVLSTPLASPVFATLTDHAQLDENKATLSPAFATLTGHVTLNPFVCHSYEKHRGVGYPSILSRQASFFPHQLHGSQQRPSTPGGCGRGCFFPLLGLLHDSPDTPGVGA